MWFIFNLAEKLFWKLSDYSYTLKKMPLSSIYNNSNKETSSTVIDLLGLRNVTNLFNEN